MPGFEQSTGRQSAKILLLNPGINLGARAAPIFELIVYPGMSNIEPPYLKTLPRFDERAQQPETLRILRIKKGFSKKLRHGSHHSKNIRALSAGMHEQVIKDDVRRN